MRYLFDSFLVILLTISTGEILIWEGGFFAGCYFGGRQKIGFKGWCMMD